MVKTLTGPDIKHFVMEKNIGEFLFNSAQKYGDRICQIDGTNDTSETYSSVKLRSTRVALAMKRRGLTSDDVISVCSANTLDNTIPMIAAFYLGVKVTNLDVTGTAKHIKHILTLVTPKLIFVEEATVKLIEESLVHKTFVTEIIVFGSHGKYTGFSEFVKEQNGEVKFRPADNVEDDDLALMIFTRGNTAHTRAICHTHRSFTFMLLQLYQNIICENLFHDISFYALFPLLLLACAFKAGTYRLFYRNPNGEDVLRLIEKYKATYIFVTPYFTYELTNFLNIGEYNISSLRMIMSTGAPLDSSQICKIREVFKNVMFSFVYELSELGLATAFHPKDDHKLAKRKIDSVGKVTPGVVLKVVQIGGIVGLGPHQKGEIYLKASSMMSGHLNTDTSNIFDEDGFLKTGDIGYFDKEGCVYITDKIKEVFMHQSHHIIPSSLEAILKEHPAIIDAIVFGVPSVDQDEELPSACVVLKEGCALTEDEIDDYMKKHVSDVERLRGGVTFFDALPATQTGKLCRHDVREIIVNDQHSTK